MSKYGIEFEMMIYVTDSALIDWVCDIFDDYGYEVGDDGSIRSEDSVMSDGYVDCGSFEMKSEPMTLDYCRKNLKNLFNALLKNKAHKVTINESGGDIRIDFNFSTGTHIHYSNVMEDFYDEDEGDYSYRTKELRYFKNRETIKTIVDYMLDNCKYKSIKDDMIRRDYSKANYDPWDRYSAFNVSDENRHGTIEFRMCNLHGVKTKDVVSALNHQITLINRAVAKGWKVAIKTEKKKMKIQFKELEKFTKVKKWRKKPVNSVTKNTPE